MSVSVTMPAKGREPAVALKLDSVAACIIVLLPLALAMSWPRVVAVWQTGTFFDTDDAMRMVQVRDWMSGQGWFDLVAHRLNPPDGLLMHWSRVVDVPLALLVGAFGLVVDPVHAERLARLTFPLALQAGMVGATAWVAKILAGPRAGFPGGILVLLSGIAYVQFQPGRIDHHAPQILLLMLATGTTLSSLDPARFRSSALTAALVALSLAVSLENLPFFAVLLSVPCLAWVVEGERQRRSMIALASGLAVAMPLMLVATVPPSRYAIGACDAYSIAHLCGIGAGACGLASLSALSSRLAGGWQRLAGVGIVSAVVVLVLHAAYPACLSDPYSGMNPLMQGLWLSKVTEAQPLMTAIRLRPDTLTLVACPIMIGLLACVVAIVRTTGLARARWLVLLGLVTIGMAGMMWEIRVATSVSPLAVLPGAWAVAAASGMRGPRLLRLLAPLALVLPFSVAAWALVPVRDIAPDVEAQIKGGMACREASNVEPLAALPPQTIFAPIDAGSHLLAHSRLAVVAAPYHRNQAGNGLVLEGFTADPAGARSLVASSGATLLGFCPTDAQMLIMARAAPHGLAAELLAGRTPQWLTPLAVDGTPYRVFRVVQPPAR